MIIKNVNKLFNDCSRALRKEKQSAITLRVRSMTMDLKMMLEKYSKMPIEGEKFTAADFPINSQAMRRIYDKAQMKNPDVGNILKMDLLMKQTTFITFVEYTNLLKEVLQDDSIKDKTNYIIIFLTIFTGYISLGYSLSYNNGEILSNAPRTKMLTTGLYELINQLPNIQKGHKFKQNLTEIPQLILLAKMFN